MNGLLAQLLTLTGALELADGLAPEEQAQALADVRRLVAACLIHQDPRLAPVVADPQFSAALNAAAAAGAALAAEHKAAGQRLRFLREPYLAHAADAGRPAQMSGPFVDGGGALVQFSFFQTATMRTVLQDIGAIINPVFFRLPQETIADDNLQVFTIPPGTVWILANLLVPNTAGFVALRVDGGSLVFDRPVRVFAANGTIQTAIGTQWTLTLQPEAAPQATADGSDGNALALQLPATLALRSNGPVSVAGAIGIAGFGSSLAFDTPSGAPLATDAAIVFTYDPASAAWSIDGNRSPLAQFNGGGSVQVALWGLPLTRVPPEQSFDAAHGGFVGVRVLGLLQSVAGGASGRVKWKDPNLIASAAGLELRARPAGAAAHLPLTLWGPARSELDFADGIASARLESRRDGADIVTWAGGRLRNYWDLPRNARGEPFAFDGTVSTFAAIAEADGLRRIAVTAQAPPPTRLHGLVLENAYLSVTPIRTLALVASGAGADSLARGQVRLGFDVVLGEPMLPDPYAANWSSPERNAAVEGALSATLRWQPNAVPELRVQLDHKVRFPEPREIAPESDPRLGERFRAHLHAQPELLGLLDLSTRDHQFGIAIESLAEQPVTIDDSNRLAVPLRSVRLLMQPQVHWEPVVELTPPHAGAVLRSGSQGGHSLMGADGPESVPLLPGVVGQAIVSVANAKRNAAALFSLPFGLRAFVHFDRVLENAINRVPPVIAFPHEPTFDGGLVSARQLRLMATGGVFPGALPGVPPNPSRTMPGALHQTRNLQNDPRGDGSVLPPEIANMVDTAFDATVPLHAADLSGYGLSCFSRWRQAQPDAVGVTQVRLDVLVGRTSYEVIEVRSLLVPCQSRVVRTIVLERRNSARVQRFDSGWQAVDDGLYASPVRFDTGALRGLRNIRRIRIQQQPRIALANGFEWQPVLFDADAEIDNLVAGGKGRLAPTLDQLGYVQTKPVSMVGGVPNPGALLTAASLAALFDAVGNMNGGTNGGTGGGTIGGALDCRARIGGTLEMHLHGLQAAVARDDVGGLGFVVALHGSPLLPRAGQWSAVRIDGVTSDVSAVDPQTGIPVLRLGGRPFIFRDPAQARLVNGKPREYGLLFSTDASRVLFARPTISIIPGQPGRLSSAPPLMADPTALVQGSGFFPRKAMVLQAREAPLFDITSDNAWRLSNTDFTFVPPLPGVASGAGWALDRTFGNGGAIPPPFKLAIDSAAQALPWQVVQPNDVLDLKVDGLGSLLSIESGFEALSGAAAGLLEPVIRFGKSLEEAQNIVNALGAFAVLPAGFKIDVDVAKGEGPSPSFIVRLKLDLTIGGGPDGRVDIGIGKLYGGFTVDGQFEAALNGKTQGRLSLLFQGDVQQGILPPLLYAGGVFRFRIEVGDSGPPVIELGLGTVTSIGGDLVKGLLAVEATVKYGYTLVPQTLKPGVMLGIEARAKLLAGLFSMSFSADALARIERFNHADKTVTIFADIRVAGSVQVAVFFEESFDFQTQFEQRVPLAPLLIAANVNPLLAVAANALI